MKAAVRLAGVSKAFESTAALAGVSFEVPEGSVTALLGPNGAGKSTLLRILVGLVRQDSGLVEVLGERSPVGVATQRRLGGLIEGPALHEGLSALDNLRVVAALLGGRPLPALRAALERVGLERHSTVRVAGFSLGMKQRLSLAVALLGEPALLLLDEPQNGLDPDGTIWLRDLLRGLAAEGHTVVLSSHALHEVGLVASHLVVLRQGRTVYAGSTGDLRRRAGPDLIVEPELVDDLGLLLALFDDAGADVRREGCAIVVRDPRRTAADFNRMAHERGVVLTRLEMRAPSLEDVFLRLQSVGGEEA